MFQIRPATIDDTDLILRYIIELAVYEKAAKEVVAAPEDIRQSLFGEGSTTDAIICSIGDTPIGFAVYFYNYSTWLGRNGLFLEDLYVTPESRGTGAGKALLKYLAQHAVSKNCGRFEWNVLDWNQSAIDFYQSIGAQPQNEWIGYRLTGEALNRFADS